MYKDIEIAGKFRWTYMCRINLKERYIFMGLILERETTEGLKGSRGEEKVQMEENLESA